MHERDGERDRGDAQEAEAATGLDVLGVLVRRQRRDRDHGRQPCVERHRDPVRRRADRAGQQCARRRGGAEARVQPDHRQHPVRPLVVGADGVRREVEEAARDAVERDRRPQRRRRLDRRQQRERGGEPGRARDGERAPADAIRERPGGGERADRGRGHQRQRRSERSRRQVARGDQVRDQHGPDPDLEAEAGEQTGGDPGRGLSCSAGHWTCQAHTLAAVGVLEVEPSGPERAGVVDKGLKKDALGFVSSVVIGVASTAPGYSLAASLGFVVAVAGIGLQAPAVLLLAFVPMLLIASAYYYMNRADPDCGTTFSWVTSAMGPSWGWLGGWAIIVADVIVMANLAQIAGLYSFLLVGWQSAARFTCSR